MTRRKKKKKANKGWTTIKFIFNNEANISGENPKVSKKIENFKFSAELLNEKTGMVKIRIDNNGDELWQFAFSSYSLEDKQQENIYNCPSKGHKIITLKLGKYFDLQYR